MWILEDGQPKEVGLTEFTQWVRDNYNAPENGVDPRRVALDEFDGIRVSTVFLMVDHSHGRCGPPLLFETMIFGGEHDQDQERYATREEAELRHAEIVGILKRGGQL